MTKGKVSLERLLTNLKSLLQYVAIIMLWLVKTLPKNLSDFLQCDKSMYLLEFCKYVCNLKRSGIDGMFLLKNGCAGINI